jgi:hypothetical protein
MAKPIKHSNAELLDSFIKNLDHPKMDLVKALMVIILVADKEIAGQVKWNSPAFYYTGEIKEFNPKEYKRDIVVMNLHKKDYVLLVFPSGAKIMDDSGILEGDFPDGRKTVKIQSMEEVLNKKDALQQVIKKWLAMVEK